MTYVYVFLGWIMNWCYDLCGNYFWAIVLFTFITKIILLPLSLWTYFKGITMIKIQPDINFIKVKYYGQRDRIAEEQAKLFKEKKYSPLVTVIPTLIQLFLLIGVVGVVRLGIDNPSINMNFGSINLGAVPAEEGLSLIWSPILAGLAAFVLCIAQNKSSVLQAEQSKLNKYGTTILSVGLSLYLGWFVAVGTAFYWVCSNLFAVLQLYICNWIVRPRRFVDYRRLEESRKQLAEIQNIGKKKRERYFSDNRRKERADYKKFFSVVNKHLVFYAESKGFYKYYKGIIEYLLENTNLTIHYITSDPDDGVFEMEKSNPKVRGYYIGENKLITLFMKMDADVVVMTTPDLETYHLKRSYVRDDIEYIYLTHGMTSFTMTARKGCMDYFDTFFCVGPHHLAECIESENLYHTKVKKKIKYGFSLLDDMRRVYLNEEHRVNDRINILIAPSWQVDNIISLCLEELLDILSRQGYHVIVRPHPQEVKTKSEYLESVKMRYENKDVEFQMDFSSEKSVLDADVLITDWSGISWEYSFTTYKPTLFINTPMKVMNPEYKILSNKPVDITYRDKLGKQVELEDLCLIPSIIEEMVKNKDKYTDSIKKLLYETVYNVGNSKEVGAKYIISAVQAQIKRKNT